MNYKDNYNQILTLFNEKYLEIVGGGGFELLERSMNYSLTAGGKRLRPCILLKTCQLFGGDMDIAMKYATAIESIHTYSLIHDDLPCMDNDDLRRGKPTNHKVFGEGNAVLAGDSLLNTAMEILIDSIVDAKTKRASVILSKASGRHGMISGQSADLYFEKKTATLDEINYINANKTGALLKSAFEIGAVLGNATEEQITLVRHLGEAYGIIFQLTDDLLDVIGNQEKVGKTLGKDKDSMKSSAVNILGIDKTKQLIENKRLECVEIISKLNIKDNFYEDLLNETINRDM